MKKRVVIVHCWGGYPEYCWYPWVKKQLEVKGFAVDVLAMPETDLPKMALWVPKLREVIGTPDGDLYLVGHSIGVATIMRYLESLPVGQNIGGAVFVAGFFDNLGMKEIYNFFETPFDVKKIKDTAQKIIAIHSDDDPYVPTKNADLMKERFNADVMMKHAMKHFSGPVDKEDSCVELPDVVDAVVKLSTSFKI